MKNTLYFIIFLGLISYSGFAQRKRICGNQVMDLIRQEQNPTKFKAQRERFEQAIENQLQINDRKKLRATAEILRIPVVVHVIHTQVNNAIKGDNISNEQIYSQIKVLNEDYRRKAGTLGFNTNAVGADTEIEFFLATKDPNGNASSGIIRKYNSKISYDIELDQDRIYLSNLSYWDSNKYLNIWVTNLATGILGYGEFPYADGIDGLDEDADERVDGIFVDHAAFGKKTGTNTKGIFSFGRTVTHEVGHWLGLYHTWGLGYELVRNVKVCDTDYVADTPPAEEENYYCDDVYSFCSGIRTKNMIENYMDYSPDSCMNIFTQGQKQRIQAVLELSKRRLRMVNYAKYELPASNSLEIIFANPLPLNQLQIQVLLPGFQNFTVSLHNIIGREIYKQNYSDLPSTIIELPSNTFSSGIYFLTVISNQQTVRKRLMLY